MVHPTQTRLAFGTDAGDAALYVLVKSGKMSVSLRPIKGGDDQLWVTKDKQRLAEILAQADLSLAPRVDVPLVLGNPRHGLLGFAFGPERVPEVLRVLWGVLDMATSSLLAAAEGQPAFRLIDARPSARLAADDPEDEEVEWSAGNRAPTCSPMPLSVWWPSDRASTRSPRFEEE